VLDRLLEDVRGGRSAVLVIRGEAGLVSVSARADEDGAARRVAAARGPTDGRDGSSALRSSKRARW
jgi:hypothetical protein